MLQKGHKLGTATDRLVSEDEILSFIRSQPLLNYREFCNTFGEGVYTETAYKRLHWHLNLTKGI